MPTSPVPPPYGLPLFIGTLPTKTPPLTSQSQLTTTTTRKSDQISIFGCLWSPSRQNFVSEDLNVA
jgi:hypothetical protein